MLTCPVSQEPTAKALWKATETGPTCEASLLYFPFLSFTNWPIVRPHPDDKARRRLEFVLKYRPPCKLRQQRNFDADNEKQRREHYSIKLSRYPVVHVSFKSTSISPCSGLNISWKVSRSSAVFLPSVN